VRQAYSEASAGDISEEANAMLHLSMVHSVRECARAVDLIYTAAGPRAVYSGSVLERAFRDIHTVTQHLLALTQNYRIVGMYLLTKNQPGGVVYDDDMKPLFR
jgi:indole-3-acetate monooxygenase